MAAQDHATYIEKPAYYQINRVFVVARGNDRLVYGQYINLDTWVSCAATIKRDEFEQRFELCPIQMHA